MSAGINRGINTSQYVSIRIETSQNYINRSWYQYWYSIRIKVYQDLLATNTSQYILIRIDISIRIGYDQYVSNTYWNTIHIETSQYRIKMSQYRINTSQYVLRRLNTYCVPIRIKTSQYFQYVLDTYPIRIETSWYIFAHCLCYYKKPFSRVPW